MSLAREMAVAGQLATADFEEDTLQNLKTGTTFRAKIQPISDIDLNTELGRDPREAMTIHVRDRFAAAAIDQPEIKLKIMTGDMAETIIKTTRRSDNPATLHVEFGCMKIVPGKDS